MSQINIFKEMVICVGFDCKSKRQKSQTAMVNKNKTQKYPVVTTCRNVSCLLLRLKSWLEKDAISDTPE